MKTIFKTAVALALMALSGLQASAQGGYGEIRGIIKNTDLEPVPFVTVKILQGNLLVGGTQTDMDGRYKYKPLTPGSYEMVVIEPGHSTQQINKIAVIPNEATYVDVKLRANTLGSVEVVAAPIDYTKTGVEKNMYSMKSIDATELMQNASYNRGDIKGAMASLTSEVIETNGENHFRGGRGDASGYFVDGVRTLNASTVPGLAIENLTFFSGGVPAMYGDLTSGAIMITTKSYFSGIRDKNMRLAYEKEKEENKKAAEKAKLDEENRKKEIEQEKLLEKQN
jgi:hypothetical protein